MVIGAINVVILFRMLDSTTDRIGPDFRDIFEELSLLIRFFVTLLASIDFIRIFS